MGDSYQPVGRGSRPARSATAVNLTLEEERALISDPEWELMAKNGKQLGSYPQQAAYWHLMGLLVSAEQAAKAGVKNWTGMRQYAELLLQQGWWGLGANGHLGRVCLQERWNGLGYGVYYPIDVPIKYMTAKGSKERVTWLAAVEAWEINALQTWAQSCDPERMVSAVHLHIYGNHPRVAEGPRKGEKTKLVGHVD